MATGNDAVPRPWATEPSGLGVATCRWCDRDIHEPALPCSITGGAGVEDATTSPGHGDRCKFELRVRGAARG